MVDAEDETRSTRSPEPSAGEEGEAMTDSKKRRGRVRAASRGPVRCSVGEELINCFFCHQQVIVIHRISPTPHSDYSIWSYNQPLRTSDSRSTALVHPSSKRLSCSVGDATAEASLERPLLWSSERQPSTISGILLGHPIRTVNCM